MDGLFDRIQTAVDFIRKQYSGQPRVGMITGTGLGTLTDQMEKQAEIPYSEIPGFPQSTAPSHSGQLVCGTINGIETVAMEGRVHYYEGYSLSDVTFPVRVMKALGANILLCTSAVGGMNGQYELADVIIIEDHINLMPDNPLRGVNDDRLGERFPDMSAPYDRDFLQRAKSAALAHGIPHHTGVLVAVPGPNLETRAEYRMLRALGADVVGMSTVPEVIVAAHAKMRVLAFSIVTDMCLPDALEAADVNEIVRIASEAEPKLSKLVMGVLAEEG